MDAGMGAQEVWGAPLLGNGHGGRDGSESQLGHSGQGPTCSQALLSCQLDCRMCEGRLTPCPRYCCGPRP